MTEQRDEGTRRHRFDGPPWLPKGFEWFERYIKRVAERRAQEAAARYVRTFKAQHRTRQLRRGWRVEGRVPMTTDTPTVGDRYARATSSSDLTMHIGRCDADKLLAAGYAARRDARGLMALHIYRMRVTGDRAGLPPAIAMTRGWWRACSACGPSRARRDAREVRARARHADALREALPSLPRRWPPPTSSVKPKHLEHSRWLAAQLVVLW